MDKASTIFLAASLIIIMLGMGLSLVVDDFKRIFVYPKAILLGLTNQLILLPLIGFAIASIFPLKPVKRTTDGITRIMVMQPFVENNCISRSWIKIQDHPK
jgi:predicted Na+-dependent transporter